MVSAFQCLGAVSVANIVSKLRESTNVRLHLTDGNEVEVVVEETQYKEATKGPEGYANPGHLYVSLVETDDVAEAYDLSPRPESLVGIYAKESEPGEWRTATMNLSEVYVDSVDVENPQLAEVDSVESID